MSAVPCNGCTLCCRREIITMEEGDDPARYPDGLREIPGPDGPIQALKHKPNGDCIYLESGGCAVYADRPVICREFDCRLAFLKLSEYPRKKRRAMARRAMLDAAVYQKGRALVDTL